MIDRYECFTGFQATNYDAERRNDGPWVSYDDHAEAMQKLWQTADTRERMNSQTIATLRAENDRLVDEAYNARQSAKGENALRLEAETSIDDLVDKAHANALDKGFWADVDTNDPRHVLALLMLITTEVAEAAEAVRKSDPDNFAEELADICIRVFDVAGGMGVDLSEEIVTKMRTNKARPRKHGKAC
jgi:NTP pyrophosphatase (non-canonical NTP hydrolase)